MKTPTLRTLNHRTLLAALLIAAAGSPLVHAEPAGDAPLQGPQVKDRKVPGGKSSFGDSTQNRRGEGRAEPRLFMAALRDLGAPDAPEGVRAEPDQMEEIRGILEEFREDQRAFRQEHAEEFRTLRKEAGMPEREGAGPGGPGGPGGQDDPAQRERRRGNQSREDRKEARAELTPEQQAARQKLRELNEKGPKFDGYQTRAWAVLSEPQQVFVKARMEELGKEVEAARAEGRRPNLGNDERPPRGPGGDNPQRERRRGRGPGAPGTNDNPPPPPGDDEMMPPPPPGDGEA